MTTVEVLSSNGNGTRLSDQEAREFAETIWAERNGEIKGAELGRLCGRTERWGSKQAARLRNAARSDAPVPAQPTGTAKAGRDRNGSSSRRNGPAMARRNASATPVPFLVLTGCAVALVTAVSLVISYTHIKHLADLAGMCGLAWWVPLGIDGLVVACSCSLIVDRRNGKKGHPVAWAGLGLGLAGSVAANALAVDPALVSIRVVRLVLACYSPLALAMASHQMFRMLGER